MANNVLEIIEEIKVKHFSCQPKPKNRTKNFYIQPQLVEEPMMSTVLSINFAIRARDRIKQNESNLQRT